MKKSKSRRGSALILALVVAILAAGLAGAFMALTTQNAKAHTKMTQADETQQICDAAVEIARAALLRWRNSDPPDVTSGPTPYSAAQYAWNKVFLVSKNAPGVLGAANPTANLIYDAATNPNPAPYPDAMAISKDALARFKSNVWTVSSDNNYNYDSTNLLSQLTDVSFTSAAPDAVISKFFGVSRRYGKGAFHMLLVNDYNDLHGDGVDNAIPASGNPWQFDAGDTANNAGTFDPMIDGNGSAILFVTATLPDGTLRQVKAVIAYPFPGSQKGAAIQANGDITLNGSFSVQGSLGSVQANGNISGNGGATAFVAVSIDASGSTSALSMQNVPKNGINSNATPLNIQPVDVASMATDAKYAQLQSRMYVFPADGSTPVWIGSGAAPMNPSSLPFTFKSGAWSLSGKGTPPNAVYFFNSDVSMSGQGNAAPYNMTVIATGSVSMGGNAAFAPATTDGSAPVYKNNDPTNYPIPTNSFGSVIVAGQDVSLRGTANGGSPQYAGSVFANEQVEIKGNFTMNGSITAADATDTPGSLVSSQNSIGPDLTLGGNPTIIDNGTASIMNMSPDHLNLISLERIR